MPESNVVGTHSARCLPRGTGPMPAHRPTRRCTQNSLCSTAECRLSAHAARRASRGSRVSSPTPSFVRQAWLTIGLVANRVRRGLPRRPASCRTVSSENREAGAWATGRETPPKASSLAVHSPGRLPCLLRRSTMAASRCRTCPRAVTGPANTTSDRPAERAPNVRPEV